MERREGARESSNPVREGEGGKGRDSRQPRALCGPTNNAKTSFVVRIFYGQSFGIHLATQPQPSEGGRGREGKGSAEHQHTGPNVGKGRHRIIREGGGSSGLIIEGSTEPGEGCRAGKGLQSAPTQWGRERAGGKGHREQVHSLCLSRSLSI